MIELRYYDITGHIIDNKFITTGDKTKPRLDLRFEIFGDTVIVEGEQESVEAWNSRFDFEEVSKVTAKARIAAFIIASNVVMPG